MGAVGSLTGVIALGSPLAALLPSRTWAVQLRVLTSAEAAALLAMIHTIAPHDGLDEAAYALVVNAIDADAAGADNAAGAGDAATAPGAPGAVTARRALAAGVASLGADFAALPEAERVARLKAIEAGAFFQSVRVTTLLVLYNNPMAWAHFGYEGEAYSKGGYLTRGFNDLKWLPDVPLGDSGALPF